MALGNSRKYGTEHRKITADLSAHAQRMEALMRKGISREEASLQAYREIISIKASSG